MKILMVTNTFTPHVGGVARSVEAFSRGYRERGHSVLTVAPTFENMPEDETDVVRVPAIQKFNGSDFSIAMPIARLLSSAVEAFRPDVIHAHHPFLLGSAALRLAYVYQKPLVFTHHTLYERYTHYVPGDSEVMKRFAISLSTSFANQCNEVIAPSESLAKLMRERGVERPITVVPTGVRLEDFARGSGPGFRAAMDIPPNAFVVGHVGRLAPEKNLELLAEAAARLLSTRTDAHCLIVGEGPSRHAIRDHFARQGVADRLHMAGTLDQPLLASAYRCMDAFAFASQSETQGMVLTEAMASAVPVVALDGPGVREVVDASNGRLLTSEATSDDLAASFGEIASMSETEISALRQGALRTAECYSIERSIDRAIEVYERVVGEAAQSAQDAYDAWTTAMRRIEAEWKVLKGFAASAEDVLVSPDSEAGSPN